MTDTDPLQALDQRIDAWLRHVYDPQTKPLEPDEPIEPPNGACKRAGLGDRRAIASELRGP